MILLALALQVGATLQPVEVKIKEARRVGQRITVEYTLTNRTTAPIRVPTSTVESPAGDKLKTGKPEDAPKKEAVPIDVAPGLTVGQTVVFDLKGTNLDTSVYNMTPQTFNESTWFFVVGGQRVPFRF